MRFFGGIVWKSLFYLYHLQLSTDPVGFVLLTWVAEQVAQSSKPKYKEGGLDRTGGFNIDSCSSTLWEQMG
jgi:hypothetical protein